MEGTPLAAHSGLSLQDLMAKAWILEVRQRLDWQDRVVRRAAQMALEDAIPVQVEDWIGDCSQGRVIWIDPASGDPIPYLVSPFPAEVGARARAAGQEQIETIRRVAEGQLSLVGWENGEEDMSWRGHVDFWAIALKYERATDAVMSEMTPDSSKQTPWDVVAERIITHARLPGLTVEALAAYSNTLACDEPTGSTEVSAEVARLNDSGLGERLQAELVERFGDALPAELRSGCAQPEGAEDASNTGASPERAELDAAGNYQRVTDEPPKADDSTYLDLMVDESRRTISRKGHDPVVDLSRREVPWHVFTVLYRQREHITTREMIERGHPGSIEGPAIRNSLNQLRTLLIPLDLTVTKNDWRLVSGALESSNAVSNGAHEGI